MKHIRAFLASLARVRGSCLLRLAGVKGSCLLRLRLLRLLITCGGNKMMGEKVLSTSGKDILLKFWWGSKEKRKLHWCTWSRLCMAKSEDLRTLLSGTMIGVGDTVKSGYWVGRDMEANPSASNSSALVKRWKALWKLAISLKIKIFVWKAYHDWIPTIINLARRGIQVDGRCLFCNSTDKMTLHALWNFQKLR
ncbi:hypothetical protein Dsin_021450 [Dipteronia sinensis]|uniref:Reverse transcriptase zinc-binding domain-containing protein n=1 Tax=Dipteronia sinensis TaxID=43782 RepID=A0AAE0A064_9ROSI|nr:hypothetical protein Dsin_021450 [Dipteronia sinensis]